MSLLEFHKARHTNSGLTPAFGGENSPPPNYLKIKTETMEKENKTRIVCMECLTTKVVNKQEEDPKTTRLIITWSCDKCSEDDDEIQFYDYQMRELDIEDSNQ